MILELSNNESDILVSLFTKTISELKEEIRRTEKYEYKENLKSEKMLMENLLTKLISVSMVGGKII